jgi:hypothetical protein
MLKCKSFVGLHLPKALFFMNAETTDILIVTMTTYKIVDKDFYGIASKVLFDQLFFSESLRLKYSTNRLVIVRYICRLFMPL